MSRDTTNFLPVMLESPYSGNLPLNLLYWKAANLHSIFQMHEAPISSHFYYTQFLDDTDPAQRALGISLGYQMWERCSKVVFYLDLGESNGMKAARKRVEKAGKPFELRYLGVDWEKWVARPTIEFFNSGTRSEPSQP